MLLKLALLLGAICAISAEIVEIDCVLSGLTCVVEKLPDELPANATWKFYCPQHCTHIRMTNAKLPRFPRELFITHQELIELYLTGTDIEELAFGDFFNAAKLNKLSIRSNNKVMSLRNNCFWGAFKLDLIDLYYNKISEMEGGAFNGIPLLTQLELQNNQVSQISNDHFRNLPNLRNIYLQFNSIETVESEAFLNNPNLSLINIFGNNLNELDLLLPFINTGTININGNQLTKVTLRSTLREFGEFDTGANVYLQSNKLTDLYIQPNFAVGSLILWQNPIERIDTLPVLKSVKLLNIQWCEIRSLDGQRFADKYVNLETLHISDNNITSFSKDTFAGLDKLNKLVMDINALTEINFPRLESLTELDLKNNSLAEFPFGENIRETFPALDVLDIRNNVFDEEYLAELVKILEDQGIHVKWEPTPH